MSNMVHHNRVDNINCRWYGWYWWQLTMMLMAQWLLTVGSSTIELKEKNKHTPSSSIICNLLILILILTRTQPCKVSHHWWILMTTTQEIPGWKHIKHSSVFYHPNAIDFHNNYCMSMTSYTLTVQQANNRTNLVRHGYVRTWNCSCGRNCSVAHHPTRPPWPMMEWIRQWWPNWGERYLPVMSPMVLVLCCCCWWCFLSVLVGDCDCGCCSICCCWCGC